MIIQGYNEIDVRNLQLREVTDELLENGKLTPPQYEQVKTAFPIEFKQSNIFVRLGLFLFTGLCILFSIVFVGWITVSSGSKEDSWGILSLFFALCLTALNEYFISDRHWYRQGSDNALCYAAIACFVMGFGLVFEFKSELAWTLLSLVFLKIATIRYGDPLLAFGSFYALMLSILIAFQEKENGYIALPFVCAGVTLGIYFWTKYMSEKEGLFYWKDCFTVLEIAGLVGFYASINYYVVEKTLEYRLENGVSTPFSTLFAVLTALVPLFYLIFGIKNKDRMLWIMGGLGIIASVLTYRYYHTIMPIEWALTLAGIAFLALAYFLIHYLKTPRHGFAYMPQRNKNNLIEALVVNQLLQQTPSNASDDSVKYGGGDFGGGGASGDF
jgi:hypothetical protein